MAKQAGISKSWVQQLWFRNDLKPHRRRTFKLSNDQQFEQKFWDIVGLYLSPPQQAVVLCCDEKSQCQALERSQPGLPLGQGYVATRTHDYYRHGTLTLFAALDYLEGKVLAQNDDGGGQLNARIIFRPNANGNFWIIGASVGMRGNGDYTVTVREKKSGGDPPP